MKEEVLLSLCRRRGQQQSYFNYGRPMEKADHYSFMLWFVMAALCNRGPLYVCPVISIVYRLSFFPRLISAAIDWISTILLHMAWP